MPATQDLARMRSAAAFFSSMGVLQRGEAPA